MVVATNPKGKIVAVYKPMPDHEYHLKSGDALRYIIADAGRAAKAMRSVNIEAECKYLDQMNDACTILNYRRRLLAGE